MVSQSDAIPNPRAMMIHLHDAFIADRAVMSSRWFYYFASFTELIVKEVHSQ